MNWLRRIFSPWKPSSPQAETACIGFHELTPAQAETIRGLPFDQAKHRAARILQDPRFFKREADPAPFLGPVPADYADLFAGHVGYVSVLHDLGLGLADPRTWPKPDKLRGHVIVGRDGECGNLWCGPLGPAIRVAEDPWDDMAFVYPSLYHYVLCDLAQDDPGRFEEFMAEA